VIIGGQGPSSNPSSTVLTFTGTIILNNLTTEVDIGPNSQISFNGPIAGSSGDLNIGNVGVGNSLAIFRGNIVSVATFNLLDTVSLIFDGDPTLQLSGVGAISTAGASGATYLGLGSGSDSDGYNQPGFTAAFITGLGSSFTGTLGFDTTTGSTSIFDDALDLSALTSTNFVGLGSATSAILGPDAVITPPGATAADRGVYPFGGGGGTLTVTSPLSNDIMNDVVRSVVLGAGNAPLTLVLSGTLDYTGDTYVDGGVLVFDAAPPMSGGSVHLGYGATKSGYFGNTTNAGYEDTDIENFLSLADVNPGATGGVVIGFDSFGDTRSIQNTNIDMSLLPTNTYIGTSTSVEFEESTTFTPNGANAYNFAGVKGGFVTVYSDLGGTSSVNVGLPKPLEAFSLQNGFVSDSSVELGGDNSYSGGTTLNSGYLYVTTSNSLGGGGSGPLTVPDPGYGRDGWIASLNTVNAMYDDVTLPNDIKLGTNGIALNFGNTNSLLTLTGAISDLPGDHAQLGIFGYVDLTGYNTYSGSTTLGAGGYLELENDHALGTGNLSVFSSGGIPTLTAGQGTPSVQVPNVIALNNAVLNINAPGSDKNMVFTGYFTDFGTDGSLVVYGEAEFHGGSTFSGGTTLNNAYVLVNNSGSLGTGGIDSEGGSTIQAFSTFTLPNPLYVGDSTSLDGDGFQFSLSGPISGSQAITINNLVEFSGDNSNFTGSILFNHGTLMASSQTALGNGETIVSSGATLGINLGLVISSTVTLNQGGKIAGYGTLAPSSPLNYTFDSGSVITGGSGTSTLFSSGVTKPVPGTLAFGSNANLYFGGGGILQFSLDGQTGAPGLDFSAINAAGTLTQTSNSMDPFIIQLVAVDPGTRQLGSFTPNLLVASSWTLISTGGISGFDPSGFTVDTTSFANGIFTSGTFDVTLSGNDLLLNFTPVPEPATWAMMASGACALGAAVRRRHRR
jgi:autotransporter-associated beta strand protein